ncbi:MULTISPECIES: phospho-N-acetylmuramoyl-pentapeptide-transferase [Actinomyces]|uniref:Phospho-N-acetylmuramoyl-pentapeptide-transferase n=2 Tax=Actinomyces TaxID=1654 RepID=A0A853ELY5_9ACTO|nr:MULTISPECIES: phospho-N-acetylmuramoyl-pentapeptide-transferase [Actinomyces]MBF0696653.1 phospho-N-acetylmuramoyl-pentapeptide-transferase [Actinomyces bowdenii]MCR2052609.1 phospho-N-acetylmuramoyl-pentapeptide-transferase [Actinomyces bowdenii]NYS68826.1 phospho-N-acetylmuramoyl-pentapeptide-transferase [Actinomyces bowdenii]BDA63279.1 phospho-N-acetylmuramoyl-pentapeptide-transferase [Actinomyces capricornis]
MTAILISGVIGLVGTLLGTPLLIRYLQVREYGQFIRQDGPQGHFTKRGTPTMGGVVIIASTVLGYAVANLSQQRVPGASGVLLLLLVVGLALIGFLDDFSKISKQRSLGLRAWQKIAGQAFIGILFSVLALNYADRNGLTPASTRLSFARDSSIDLAFAGAAVGLVLFIIWANFLITAWSNAVNLTDGLDGLAAGASAMVFGAYTLIGVWQINQSCLYGHSEVVATTCYQVRDPRDLAMISVALMGACFGFLWWNASPAKIFMGDTGSLALGGALAGLSILTRTEFLAVILGGLFLAEVLSDVIQIGSFKITGKRVFRMAPLHHHFELGGWSEVNVVIRFWIIAGLCVIVGLGLFYAEYLVA